MAAAGLGAFLVLAVGLTDGGYYGRAATALTLAFAAVAALGVLHGAPRRLSRAGLTVVAALVLLVGWVALSSAWAVPGALGRGRGPARGGLRVRAGRGAAHDRRALAVSRSCLGYSAGSRCSASWRSRCARRPARSVDRFYGTLLEEPVGYPNALGVLAALGITLASGSQAAGWLRDRVLGGSAALLVLVLGLSGSRGAALALGVGLCLLVALRAPGTRVAAALRAVGALVVGGAAWAVADQRGRRWPRGWWGSHWGPRSRVRSSGCPSGWRRDAR